MIIKLGDIGKQVSNLQKSLGIPITGKFDELTEAAIKNLQMKLGQVPNGQFDSSKLSHLLDDLEDEYDLSIVEIQKRIGTTPDGFWGPKSIATCQKYLRSLGPIKNPWPSSKNVSKFYGKPGDNLIRIKVDGIKYVGVEEPKPVTSILCHEKIADSLQSIIQDIKQSQSNWILNHYAGCYNNRNMRGSTNLSLHAYGIAVDFWPKENGFRTAWPNPAKMPFDIIEIFSKHGWTSAAAFWGRDAMHFQATKP